MRALFAVLLGTVLAVRAAPPAFPFGDDTLAAPTLAARPATALRLGGFTVEFEKTSMLEVLRRIGSGEIHSQGDAGGFLAWVCYQLPDKDGKTAQTLWITSGELQGGQIADGVIASAAAQPAPGDCAVLPERFRPAQLDGGLWLGSSRGEADQVLTKLSAERAGWLEYVYSRKYKDEYRDSDRGNTASVEYEESSSLLLRLLDGRVAELHANKTTTY